LAEDFPDIHMLQHRMKPVGRARKNAFRIGGNGLTQIEQKKNIAPCRQPREFAMSITPPLSDNSRHEQACDQAIAMCDGNLRSTIKALIMANEYLEIELEELQAAIAAGCAPAKSAHVESDAA
jgi:hypothetical protein